VGSAGIHIIEVKSLSCIRTILAHPEQVVDMALSDDTRYVFENIQVVMVTKVKDSTARLIVLVR
jgi:hypothetical protein